MSADHGHATSGDNTIWKAVGVGFLVLIFVNGNLSTGMQWAIIAGAIAYFWMTKKGDAGGHH